MVLQFRQGRISGKRFVDDPPIYPRSKLAKYCLEKKRYDCYNRKKYLKNLNVKLFHIFMIEVKILRKKRTHCSNKLAL